jgi:ribosomal protein L24E
MKTAVCSKCSKVCNPGYNAIYNEGDAVICDACANVRRDREGIAWTPEERRNGATFIDREGNVTYKVYVTRK